MTSKERVTAALNGESTDYMPFSPFLAYVWEHFPKEVRDQGQLAFHKHIGADPMWRGAPCPVRAIGPKIETRSFVENGLNVTEIQTPMGSIRQGSRHSSEGNTHFLVEHPLKRPDDYKVQLWIEENTRFELNLEPVNNHLAGAGEEGLSVGMLIPRGKSAYQSLVEHHVGTVELVYALVDYPDTVRTLYQQMVENDLKAVRLAVEAGYDYFLTWEDSGTQNYSPSQYDEFIGTEIGQWCDILTQSGKRYIQHACGNVKALVGRMREHGAYGVESIAVPPTGDVSIGEARDIAGDSFAIIGGIEPTLFLDLSEDELGPYVEQVIEEGKGGPFVLANSDSCPPGVTVEKFKQAADVARACRG